MSMTMSTPEQDKTAFDAYVAKHGRLPPVDHPTLGEASDYGRNGSSRASALVVSILIIVGLLAFAYVITGLYNLGTDVIQ